MGYRYQCARYPDLGLVSSSVRLFEVVFWTRPHGLCVAFISKKSQHPFSDCSWQLAGCPSGAGERTGVPGHRTV